jgi:hypothetical protein
MLVLPQQGASQVESFGLLDIAGAGHLTYKYACLCQKSSESSLLLSFLPIPHNAFETKVIFCVRAVLPPVLAIINGFSLTWHSQVI